MQRFAHQQHMPQPRKVLGLLALEPQELARREARHQLVAEDLRQLSSFVRALHVTPQLCRPDDLRMVKVSSMQSL